MTSTTTTAEIAAADEEIGKTRAKIDALMNLLPGLEARRADAADRERRAAVTRLREEIAPTLGADAEELRSATSAVTEAVAHLIAVATSHNKRVTDQVAAMTALGVAQHPQGVAPMPSPEFAGLGWSKQRGMAVVVDMRHERVVDPAALVEAALENGRRVATGEEPLEVRALDHVSVTVEQPAPCRYFVAENGVVHAFDAEHVSRWGTSERSRFLGEIGQSDAYALGWGAARIERREAGGIEVIATTPKR